MTALSDEERRLLDGYQRDFPLLQQPFAVIAAELGMAEDEVIESCQRLQDDGVISRIGATITPHRSGWSTLAAMAVPPQRLEQVAALVSARPEVNHNYERENEINLWFVVTAASREDVAGVLDDIAQRTGIKVLDLPLEEPFRLDLGFPLQWS